MTIEEEIQYWIDNPDIVPALERVDELGEIYPAFILPARLLLERAGHTVDDETRRRLLVRVALNSSDQEALRDILDPMAAGFDDFYLRRSLRRLLERRLRSINLSIPTELLIPERRRYSLVLYSILRLITHSSLPGRRRRVFLRETMPPKEARTV